MNKLVCTVTLLTSLFAGQAFAGCTAEQAQQKGVDVATELSNAAQKDPQKALKLQQEFATAVQKDLPTIQSTGDLDKLCDFYDNWLKKIK